MKQGQAAEAAKTSGHLLLVIILMIRIMIIRLIMKPMIMIPR